MSENSSESKPPQSKKVMFIVTQDGCPPCPDYEKLAREAAPQDVTVKEVKLGRNEDVDSLITGLGVERTPTALYIENGKVRRMLTPSGKPEADREAIANVRNEETKNETVEGCPATYETGPEGWHVELAGGQGCEKEVAAAKSLGPGGRKNLKVHLSSEDEKIQELLKRLSE